MRDLKKYYSERSTWRVSSQENMRFKAASKLISFAPNAAVLDIGCRDGNLRGFLPKDIRFTGIDIAEEFKSDNIIIADVSEGIPFPNNSFDVIFMIDVLEHTLKPHEIFREIKRVMKKDAHFVISVPNPYHFIDLISNVFNIKDRQGHIFSWTKQAMIAFGETSGFKINQTSGTYFYPPMPANGILARSIIYDFKNLE
tara:strand:- start:712 stop:1305 length:594 start_codon:yes stop_codon:yes gene_type:complete